MEKIMENKKIIYAIIALIIVVGIISIFTLKLNFTLEYSDNTRINVYLGKYYNMEDVKQIAEEVFSNQEIMYQEIENFHDSVAITVKEANEEQINNLKTKLGEKYEIENTDEILETNYIPHLRGRDIIKPYAIPMIIATIIILAYVGIRYMNLGIFKTIFTLIIRLVVAGALLLSIIAIARIKIGVYTMPIAITIYLLVTIYTVMQYQNELEIKKEKEEEENKKIRIKE